MGQEKIVGIHQAGLGPVRFMHRVRVSVTLVTIALAALCAIELYWLAFAITGCLLLILSYMYPREAILLLIGFTFVQNLPHELIAEVPQNIDWLDEALLVALTLRWLVPAVLGQRKFKRTPIDTIIIAFLALYSISAIMNKIPALNGFLGFRDVFQYLLLYYIIVQGQYDSRFLKQLVYVLLSIGFLQLVIVLVQLIVYFSENQSFFIEDEATGLMGSGGAHRLGYFTALIFMVYLGLFRFKAKKSIAPLLVYAVVITISSTRAVFFFIPMVLGLLSLKDIIRQPRRILYWLGIGLFFAVPLFGYMVVSPEHAESLRRPSRLYRQQRILREEGGLLGRIGFLKYSFQTLQESGNLFLGTGPGTYVSKTGSRLSAPLYRKYQQDFPYENAFPTGSQISPTLTEYGFLGSILIVLVFVSLFKALSVIYRKSQDRFWKGLGWGTMGALLVYLISIMSGNVFEMQSVSLTIWLLSAITMSSTQNSLG